MAKLKPKKEVSKNICEYCGVSVAHNKGDKPESYCFSCRNKFQAEDDEVTLMKMLQGVA